jgi:hypothetical protein
MTLPTSPIRQLLISPPARPDDPAWSQAAHSMDDRVRRAAYHGLVLGLFSHTPESRERHERQRQAYIDGAKQIATEHGYQLGASIESQVSLIERTTERAYEEWCEVHHSEIMQVHYQHNPEAARRLLTGDDDDSEN